MPKRPRTTEDEYEEAEPIPTEDETVSRREATGRIIRMVLGRELRQQSIRREHISQASASTRRASYEQLFNTVQAEMEQVYGMKLVEASSVLGDSSALDASRDTTPTDGVSQSFKSKSKQPMVVTSTLTPASKSVLSRLWTKRRLLPAETEQQAFIPKRTRGIAPLLHVDLLKTGMATFVIVLLIVGNNHLTERDLWRELGRMGLPDSLNIKNSNTGMSKAEFVNDLVKREYIQKCVYNPGKKTARSGASAELLLSFTLGRRALTEFGPDSTYALIKEIYGNQFDANLLEQCVATIEAAFQVKFEPQAEPTETNARVEAVRVKGENGEGPI